MKNTVERPHNCQFDVQVVENVTLVGELHTRKTDIDYGPSDRYFQHLLSQHQRTIYVLEADPSTSGFYRQAEVKDNFANQALTFAVEHKHPYVIMDDGRLSEVEVWQFAGSDISPADQVFLSTFRRTIGLQRLGVSPMTLLDRLKSKQPPAVYDDSRRLAIELYLNKIYRDPQKLLLLQQLVLAEGSYDAVCRERVYQNKMGQIQSNYADINVLAIFGQQHIAGIARTLNDQSYRTPLPDSKPLLDLFTQLLSSSSPQ